MTIEEAVKRIRHFYLEERRIPSYAELSELLGFSSKKAGFDWGNKLIEAGILGKDAKGKLFPKGLFHIPHLGIIKAGYPSQAEAQIGDSIDFYRYLLNLPGDYFSLTVKGESMIEAGINEGDIVIIDKNKSPRDDEIVAACVDGEWTVKYFRKRNEGVCLVPANPEFPVIYPQESLEIGGVVVSVIRKYH